MKKVSFFFLLFFTAVVAKAQTEAKTYWDMAIISETGDTIAMYNLNPVYVFAPMKFKDEKQRQAYSKLVRDVKITYPYARKRAEEFSEDNIVPMYEKFYEKIAGS